MKRFLCALVMLMVFVKGVEAVEMKLSGIYPAALTPMHENGNCNARALADHCKDLIGRGCSGVVLFGATGEGPSFSVEERKEALKTVIALGVDPQNIIMGIICSAVPDAIELACASVKHGCLAALIAPPFFYKGVKEEGVIAFYREIVQKVNNPNLKILLYHVPQLSGVPITLRVIKALRDEFPENIIGFKESEGNLALTKSVLEECPEISVFVGNEGHISEAVRLGAAGGISGIANIYPELICSLYAFGKDPEKVDENPRLQAFVQALRDYRLFPALKNLLESKKGIQWHAMRPSFVPLSIEESHSWIETVQKIGL